jgi:hypothetical protein
VLHHLVVVCLFVFIVYLTARNFMINVKLSEFVFSGFLVLTLVGCGRASDAVIQSASTPAIRVEQTQASVNHALAELISTRAENQSAGQSLGQCWKYANDAVTGRGGERMGNYALQFPQLYSESEMKSLFGLCHLRNSDGSKELDVENAPVGSVIGYAPGMHGFNAKWGHGEVKVGDGRFCSDFCTSRGSFRASMILFPCARGAYNGL